MIPRVAINVIYNLLPMLILFSVVLITTRLIYLKTNNKPFILYKELLNLSFIIYILLLFELVTSSDFNSYSNNFIPFKEIFRYYFTSKLFYRNVLGNVAIFIPFGFFTSYYCKLKKVYLNLIITFVTSLSVELIQSLIGRSFDIDDIILNLAGGFLGYLIYLITLKLLIKFPIKTKNNIFLNLICIVIILILCYLILSLYGVSL